MLNSDMVSWWTRFKSKEGRWEVYTQGRSTIVKSISRSRLPEFFGSRKFISKIYKTLGIWLTMTWVFIA